MSKVRMQTPAKAYIFDYPQAVVFADTQEDVFWRGREIEVAKDIQDMKVNMSEAEQHGVITTLKLFTLYELVAGNEYWGGRFKRMFPRPDFEQMGSTFSFVELGTHAVFYNKLNTALNLDNEEFYTSYADDPVLSERMEYIDSIISEPDDLVSIGAFSMVEGAILYSAFAFLKHFQANGKNSLLNVVAGINFSVRDEDLHCQGGAWAFKQLLTEKLEAKHDVDLVVLRQKLVKVAVNLYKHECHIIDMLFEKGDIEGCCPVEMKTFVRSRINHVLGLLDLDPLYRVEDNPIAEWFYKDINMQKFGDFFVSMSADYNRDWVEEKLAWPTQFIIS